MRISALVLFAAGSMWFAPSACRPPRGKGTYRPHGKPFVGQNQNSSVFVGVQHDEVCGLARPRKQDFTGKLKANFTSWLNENFNNYVNSDYSSFPLYMAGEFAPEFSHSKMVCDGLGGSCSITTCKDISTNLSRTDRQNAYYAFEMLANINHVYEIQNDAVKSSTTYVGGRYRELVDKFTLAKSMQNKAIERGKVAETVTSVITSMLLIASAFAGFPGVAEGMAGSIAVQKSTVEAVKTYMPAGANLFTSYFIGMHGIVKATMSRDNTHQVQDVENTFQTFWNEMAHSAGVNGQTEITRLMAGDVGPAPAKLKLVDLMNSGEFIEIENGFRLALAQTYERHFFAVALNGLWNIERPYIVDTDSANCETDKRGPPRNRVCLPERPGRAYWVYTIDHMEENDFNKDDQTQVRSPTGLRKIMENPGAYYNMTKEDVVKSSLFWHENPKLEEKMNSQKPKVDQPLLPGGDDFGFHNAGTLPGVFNIAVCRNPGGEAISSVWHDTARNYPCMCGPFPWSGWRRELDESYRFLRKSGLYASEDFEDYCSDHNHCKGQNNINWDFKPDPGMPPRAKHLKHPFKKCKEPKQHTTWGSPNMDQ